MIYTILKYFSHLVLKIYFKNKHIKGIENLPKDGPFIIVANHPSSFLDPISIAVLVKQKINFLAKGVLFKNKIIASILKGLNILPIHRAQDDPKMLSGNQAIFEACYKKISEKGVIMIFPEGTSENERKLRKIKTGAARIALGAAKENNFNLEIKIIPVGLNYTNSDQFRSELYIEFGKPINCSNYYENFKKEEITTTKKLTQKIENEIKNNIINIDNEEYNDLVVQLEALYNNQTLNKNTDKEDPFEKIKISQNIYSAIKLVQKKDSFLFHQMKIKINNYFLKLNKVKIKTKSLEESTAKENISFYIFKSIIILITGFPIWLFGYINSYIPYKIPKIVTIKITKDEAFYGALLMSIGALSFILMYSLFIYIAWHFTQSLLFTVCYGIALPMSSFFTIFYARVARRFYYKSQFMNQFFKNHNLVASLILEQKNLITELESIKEKYIKL